MKLLLAMCVMANRTGAELFVRDVALALQQRGHTVTVYAPIMGEMVDELRARCVACVTDLQRIVEPPDLILGNTREETVACMARFLGVPAISICHDRTAPHGQPPRLTRIRQHIAVDANCAERLYLEHGIAQAAVQIIGNGVDLRRFQPRSPLPDRPLRAAIFSNYATEGEETSAIRAACEVQGIALDVVGSGVGCQAVSPEMVLGQYDLVFAKARAAMEAMAVGCAVVLFNEGMGLGGMVTRERARDWHLWNFGRRLLTRSVTVESVLAEIRAYEPRDAAAVTAHVRSHASLDACVRALEGQALRILAEEPMRKPVDAALEIQEFAQHVVDTLQPLGATPVAHLHSSLAIAQAQQHKVEQLLRAQLAEKDEQLKGLFAQLAAQSHQTHSRDAELVASRLQHQSEAAQHAALKMQVESLQLGLHHISEHRQDLLNSWSWRITGPMRWLGRWFKRSQPPCARDSGP